MEWIGLIQFYKEMTLFKKTYGISLRQHRALHMNQCNVGAHCVFVCCSGAGKTLYVLLAPKHGESNISYVVHLKF